MGTLKGMLPIRKGFKQSDIWTKVVFFYDRFILFCKICKIWLLTSIKHLGSPREAPWKGGLMMTRMLWGRVDEEVSKIIERESGGGATKEDKEGRDANEEVSEREGIEGLGCWMGKICKMGDEDGENV